MRKSLPAAIALIFLQGCRSLSGVSNDDCNEEKQGSIYSMSFAKETIWNETTLKGAVTLSKVDFRGEADGFSHCRAVESGRADISSTKTPLDITLCAGGKVKRFALNSGDVLETTEFLPSDTYATFILAKLRDENCKVEAIPIFKSNLKFDGANVYKDAQACQSAWLPLVNIQPDAESCKSKFER